MVEQVLGAYMILILSLCPSYLPLSRPPTLPQADHQMTVAEQLLEIEFQIQFCINNTMYACIHVQTKCLELHQHNITIRSAFIRFILRRSVSDPYRNYDHDGFETIKVT